jgi:Holliday junction resolvase RusA-like endonuclease
LTRKCLDTFPLSYPLKCTVRIWRPNAIRRDIHNLFLKPVFDAFSEVGIWPDDSETYCPVVEYIFMGIDRINPRIEFTFERINKCQN